MRIVFVNSCPYLGGAELWHLRAACAFSERGHHVALMARPGPLARQAKEAGLAVVELPMSFDLDLLSAARAFAFFRSFHPDLILLNDQRECRVIAPAARAAGVKIRVQRKGWPFLKGSWRDRAVYSFFVTHVIANSEHIAEIFRQKSGLSQDRIAMFPNPIDLDRFQPGNRDAARQKLGLPASRVIVGSLGRLVPQKGFSDLVRGVSVLKEQGLDPALVIAGAGGERGGLEALAAELGVDLILPGHLEDAAGFLRALDVFAFPSRSEGRSNALGEAMATGLPAAASAIPGNDELVKDGLTGLLFEPGDPVSLASAVGRLIADPELAARLGQEARRFLAATMEKSMILDRLESHLQGLIDQAGSGSR